MEDLKQGDMVKPIDLNGDFVGECEFISMTSDNCYLCWNEDKKTANAWYKVKKIEPIEPVEYYYQWEKLYEGSIITSNYITDNRAESGGYTSDNNLWRHMESSKRTW